MVDITTESEYSKSQERGKTMDKLIPMLYAAKLFYQRAHWTANSYELHLLFEKVLEGIDDSIDEIAELCIATGIEIPQAKAMSQDITMDLDQSDVNFDDHLISKAISLETNMIGVIEALIKATENEGVIAMLSELSRNRQRKLYLIGIQSKGLIK